MLLKYLLPATLLAIVENVSSHPETSNIMWVGGSIDFPDKTTEALLKNSGQYVSRNMVATRLQIYGDYAYVAFPRYRPGAAVTLTQVSLKPNGCESTLKPFPCLLTQEEGNCAALQNAVDLYLDAQDVLWVLDTGVVQALVNPIRRCPPKVIAFSVKTGKLLKTIDLSGLVNEASRLQNILVEYANNGRPYIYICDAATTAILVYDVVANRGYRVVLPRAVSAGCNRRDVLYTLLIRKGCGNNFLVFTYLCGNRVFSIRTDNLRAGATSGNVIDLGLKPSPLFFAGSDSGSSIFLRIVGSTEILRWDTNTPLAATNFVSVDKPQTNVLFSSQVVPDQKVQRMRYLTANYPDFAAGTVGSGAIQVIETIEGSNC